MKLLFEGALLALVLAAGFAALVDLGEDVDLTKRHNVVLLMTIALMLLAIAAVLVAKGLLVLGPIGVTMVASGQLAA